MEVLTKTMQLLGMTGTEVFYQLFKNYVVLKFNLGRSQNSVGMEIYLNPMTM